MKIIIATHILSRGPAEELKKYLVSRKIEKLLRITHPLEYNERLNGDGYEIIENGISKKKYFNKIRKQNILISFIKSFILNIYYSYLQKNIEKYDLYIGYNNLNAISGIILKKLGIVKKTIYYVVDYTPKRFENKILNYIYHKIESICAKYCDETWNLSQRMIDAREKFKGLKKEDCGIQKIVPMGIWYNEIKKYNFSEINKNQLIYIGSILKKQGVQYILEAIPLIINHISNFKFVVIGDGEYLNELKKLSKSLNIENYVEFLGYIDDEKKIDELIGISELAIALYEKGDLLTNFTYYSDPGKIKKYLGAGVPILISDVPHNAIEIQNNKCGIIVENDKLSIQNAIIEILKDEKLLYEYKQNCIEYSKSFDWNKIFNNLLN